MMEMAMSISQPQPVSALLESMALIPQQIGAALVGREVDWQRAPGDNEWNLTQVLCHLRDVEQEVHQPRFRQLIETDDVFIQGRDADTWASPRQYHLQDGPQALADYLQARKVTLALLRTVEAQNWERKGQHAFFGETSMHELLSLMIRHDQLHLEQIRVLLSR
jgi:hypothetical protein